jgi:inner membrane protein
MDPISQGVLGACLAESASAPRELRTAAVLGAAAGLAADLDTLIQSPSDPLLFLEYHRQFTHALAFAPVGALLVAAAFYAWSRRWLSFGRGYVFCLVGFASHGLLDACTSYGTQLLWPFSDARIAWSNVSVVDPLFTVPVIALVALALARRRRGFAWAAAVWAAVYLGFGVLQAERALASTEALSASRGHAPVRLEAKPAFGSVFLWKTIYEYDGRYYVDAVRTGLPVQIYPGRAIDKLDVAAQFPWLAPDSQQARDIVRFDRIANGFLALDDRAANRIVDMRYSMVPNEIDAFWAIELNPAAPDDAHVRFVTTRERAPEQLRRLLDMLF